MEKRVHLYVPQKSFLAYLCTLCMISSAAARIFFWSDQPASADIWSQLFLPIAAALGYAAIALLSGEECFYKTAIPVWMMALYCGIWVARILPNRFMIWLFWIVLVFLALVYTEISSGMRPKCAFLLMPILLAPLATVLYIHKQDILIRNWDALHLVFPDILVILGAVFLSLGIRVHSANVYHRTWGDRSDGRRIRTLAAMDQVSPYIMVERNTATNLFEDSFEITNVDKYIRKKRREGMLNFGIMHVFLACYCRSVARYPGLNRFISGQKVYTHGEDIQFCLTIKKEMSTKSPETIIKVHLTPRDTAKDVYDKVNQKIEKAKDSPLDSGFDNTAHALMLIPGVILKFVVWGLKTMDYFGLIPKFLLEVSPFHGSIFFTSMGSLGIPPIYHHLYDFGNLPVFGAFGCKRRATEVQEDGTLVQKKYVDFKFSLDERIVDGYYYAAFFKHFKRILAHPEILDFPPEEVHTDID